MRKLHFMFSLLIGSVVLAASAGALKEQAYEHYQRAVTKQKELKTKEYSGTWDEILAIRVADVNEVTAEVALSKAAAQAAIEVGDPNRPDKLTVKEFIAQTIARRTKEPEYQGKHRNGVFLQAIEAAVNDPNALPPPEDPNYLSEIERLEDLRTQALNLVMASGGI
jgi:hypothetical protein